MNAVKLQFILFYFCRESDLWPQQALHVAAHIGCRSGTHPSSYTAIGRQAIAYACGSQEEEKSVPKRCTALRKRDLLYHLWDARNAWRNAVHARARAASRSCSQSTFRGTMAMNFETLARRGDWMRRLRGPGRIDTVRLFACVRLLNAPEGQPFPVNAAAPRKLRLTLPVPSAQLLYLLRNSDEKIKAKVHRSCKKRLLCKVEQGRGNSPHSSITDRTTPTT